MYVDETLFGKRSLVQRDWANKNSNLTVNQEDVCQNYRNVVAAITEDGGVYHTMIQDDPFKGSDFQYFVHALSQKMNGEPFALFMDGASIHKDREVKKDFIELNVTPILNVAYSPEFNPIEAVFSKVKRIYCNRRLNHLVNKVFFNVEREIKHAFK